MTKYIPVFYEYDHRRPIGNAIVDKDGNATISIHDKEIVKLVQGDVLVGLSLTGSYRRPPSVVTHIDEQKELKVVMESLRQLAKNTRTPENVILLGVNITSSNHDPKEIIKRAMRELELTFGDAVKFAFSEIKPK